MEKIKKKKHYWKIVDSFDGKYTSIIISNPKLKLKYSIGKKTTPKVGKLFVFGTRETARQFVKSLKDYKILKVKVIGNVYSATIRGSVDMSLEETRKFWYNLDKESPVTGWTTPPVGTYYADAVIPIEESR